jgi:hypothetical protein
MNDQHMRPRLLTGSILSAAGIAAVLILGSAGYRTGVKADGCIANPVVTTNADNGPGSLRQAIADACTGSTITFANTVISPITLASELSIDENLTIQGPGAGSLTISGNNSVRVFNIGSVTPAINVTLSGLTLSNGNAPIVGGLAFGGCIFNNSASTLTITSVTVSNSTAQGVFGMGGAGILNNNTGTLDITNSTISGNSASDGFGGAILNNVTGTVNITNSTISGNSAGDGTGGAYDGAGTLNVTGSTISGNTARLGGGVCLLISGASNVANSTISGNTALLVGGGAFVSTQATLTLTNSTVSNNSAGEENGGLFVDIFGRIDIENTIIALNTGVSSRGPDVDGLFTSLGHNLIGKGDGSSGFINGVNGDRVGTDASPLDPKLGPLQNNGGPTQTLALLVGSPAIDAGDDSVLGAPLTLTTDQRGPGFPRKTGTHVDIGAVAFRVCQAIDATLSGSTTICRGGSAIVSVIVSGGAPPYTITLSNGGGTLTGPSPLTFTITPSTSTTYFFSSGTDSDNCPLTGVESATVMFDTAITATVTGGATICPGGMAAVTVSLIGGTPPYTVMLNNGGGMARGSSPLTFMVQPSATTTYSLSSGMDSIGCSVAAMGSATVTLNSPLLVTVNPVSQTAASGTVTFTAAATGDPAPTVQWQVSTDGGASFTNIPSATSTTLSVTITPRVSGDEFRAVFTNKCGTATTSAALLTVFNICLKGNSNGNLLQWNSATGQYKFTLCSTGFTLTGVGVIKTVDGARTLKDTQSDRKIRAVFLTGQRTGSAKIDIMVTPGVWQTFQINDTKPAAVCACAG